jgi:hypothetical protein
MHQGRVVLHAHDVLVNDAILVVQEAGRQRVIREKRKNVHAFVRGTLIGYVPMGKHEGVGYLGTGKDKVQVSYNPFAGPSFTRKDTGEPVHSAEQVRGYTVVQPGGPCKPVLKAVTQFAAPGDALRHLMEVNEG